MSLKTTIFKFAFCIKITVALVLIIQTRLMKAYDYPKLITQTISQSNKSIRDSIIAGDEGRNSLIISKLHDKESLAKVSRVKRSEHSTRKLVHSKEPDVYLTEHSVPLGERSSATCQQTGPCACQIDSGGHVDLSPLAGNGA